LMMDQRGGWVVVVAAEVSVVVGQGTRVHGVSRLAGS